MWILQTLNSERLLRTLSMAIHSISASCHKSHRTQAMRKCFRCTAHRFYKMWKIGGESGHNYVRALSLPPFHLAESTSYCRTRDCLWIAHPRTNNRQNLRPTLHFDPGFVEHCIPLPLPLLRLALAAWIYKTAVCKARGSSCGISCEIVDPGRRVHAL